MLSADDPAHSKTSPPLSAGERVALGIVASALIHAVLYFAIRPQPAPKLAPQTRLTVKLAAQSAPTEVIRPPVAEKSIAAPEGLDKAGQSFAIEPKPNDEPFAEKPAQPSSPEQKAEPPAPDPSVPPTPSSSEPSASAFQGESGGLPGLAVPLAEDPTYYPARQLDASATPANPVMPDYPPRAAERNIVGKVVLLLLIDEKGDVRDASIVSAEPEGWGFEESALAAFQGQKFKPAVKNGHAVKSRFLLSVTFELTDAARLR